MKQGHIVLSAHVGQRQNSVDIIHSCSEQTQTPLSRVSAATVGHPVASLN